MTDKLSELKPCPFCGCDEICHASDEVYCESCFATICDTEHWNERDKTFLELEIDLATAHKVADDLVTAHGIAMGEKCREIARLNIENDRRWNLLGDVVNELNLSASAIEKHGPLGTDPAELVRLVLKEKDMVIAGLRAGMVIIDGTTEKGASDGV